MTPTRGISVSGVSKRFGDNQVVDDVTLGAGAGSLTYLLGPNGAGKTTVLRMIAGLTTPDAGIITVDGCRLRDFAQVKRAVGFGLNPFAHNPKHSARQHLRWQARLGGIPLTDADRVLDLVGLGSVSGRLTGRFSYGMLQRLGIATALLGDPRCVVLDEPANGLDVEGTLWLRELFGTLTTRGKSLLVASHSLSEVEITADRIIIMGKGRILTDADRDEVLALGTGPRRLESAYVEITRTSVDYVGGGSSR
ncbi:ABC-2 type transport system ATP-binding protein [Gordonia amarae]|uniref:Putative ABC transporter ATP-binding protein n=1 Tax=Gordonia amarae NBRC 15530 TaxID=1075090 RepID=G7GJ31_9ACTN|nr:ATP-binding cassette domain-containing protein [Gordonia amarae]MCS3879260.1 ABC-2 type transport system ATP-binding protein [Gordonia amarae]GAB03606.1 putative ABC transporter ATP-binding protein [Gordonia amarae NBRC 15530]